MTREQSCSVERRPAEKALWTTPSAIHRAHEGGTSVAHQRGAVTATGWGGAGGGFGAGGGVRGWGGDQGDWGGSQGGIGIWAIAAEYCTGAAM